MKSWHEMWEQFLETRLAIFVDTLRCKQKLLWMIRRRIVVGLTSPRIEQGSTDQWQVHRSECGPRKELGAGWQFGRWKERLHWNKIWKVWKKWTLRTIVWVSCEIENKKNILSGKESSKILWLNNFKIYLYKQLQHIKYSI